jgi:hypothetical protein
MRFCQRSDLDGWWNSLHSMSTIFSNLSPQADCKSGGGSTVFSKWGEHVTEVAPSSKDTIAYAKVLGTK